MQNDMRDRLIDLLINADVYDSYECKLCTKEDYCDYCNAEKLANYLIANGVIVTPCKVGDKIYTIEKCECDNIDGKYTFCEFYKNGTDDMVCTLPKGTRCTYKFRIKEIVASWCDLLMYIRSWDTLFFGSKEQAEQKLKELRENG